MAGPKSQMEKITWKIMTPLSPIIPSASFNYNGACAGSGTFRWLWYTTSMRSLNMAHMPATANRQWHLTYSTLTRACSHTHRRGVLVCMAYISSVALTICHNTHIAAHNCQISRLRYRERSLLIISSHQLCRRKLLCRHRWVARLRLRNSMSVMNGNWCSFSILAHGNVIHTIIWKYFHSRSHTATSKPCCKRIHERKLSSLTSHCLRML